MRPTNSLSLLWTAVAVTLVGAVACSSPDAPHRLSLSAPLTVAVGDIVTITTDAKVDDSVYVSLGETDFRVTQQVWGATAPSSTGSLYGVGVGTAQIRASLQRLNADGTQTTLATDSATLTVVAPPASNRPAFSQIASGEVSSCALSSDGVAYCWGNVGGFRSFSPRCEEYIVHQLSRGCNSVPVQLQSVPQFKAITVGTYSTCAITNTDDAFCWGIGPNNYGNSSGTPATVAGGIKFKALSVERGYGLNYGSEAEHVCGISISNQLYCWVRGGSPTAPAPIAGGDYGAVSVGGESYPNSDDYRACALDNSGVAYCWGTLALGDGVPAHSSEQTTPVAVGGSLRFKAIASEVYSTCALSTAGEPYCWGGPDNSSLAPTPVPTLLRFTTISAGQTRFCAIAIDESVYCWNDNQRQSEPTHVASSFHFRTISVGGPVTCGLTVEGPEVCWGGKGLGDVGDGIVANVSTSIPTAIAGQRTAP